jgi:hypothetical protein
VVEQQKEEQKEAELLNAWATAADPLEQFSSKPSQDEVQSVMDKMMEDPEVAKVLQQQDGTVDPSSLVSMISNPTVQKAMEDPAMQKLLQDPAVVQQQIGLMKESVTTEALSEAERLQVKTMLSAQLGVAVDQVDDFLVDLDEQPISAQQKDILQLFKTMLSGETSGGSPQPAAPAVASPVDASLPTPAAPSGFEWSTVDTEEGDKA